MGVNNLNFIYEQILTFKMYYLMSFPIVSLPNGLDKCFLVFM